MAAYHYPVTGTRIPNNIEKTGISRIIETVRSLAQDSWNAHRMCFYAFGKRFDFIVIDRSNVQVTCGGEDCGIRIVRGIAELDRR